MAVYGMVQHNNQERLTLAASLLPKAETHKTYVRPSCKRDALNAR